MTNSSSHSKGSNGKCSDQRTAKEQQSLPPDSGTSANPELVTQVSSWSGNYTWMKLQGQTPAGHKKNEAHWRQWRKHKQHLLNMKRMQDHLLKRNGEKLSAGCCLWQGCHISKQILAKLETWPSAWTTYIPCREVAVIIAPTTVSGCMCSLIEMVNWPIGRWCLILESSGFLTKQDLSYKVLWSFLHDK